MYVCIYVCYVQLTLLCIFTYLLYTLLCDDACKVIEQRNIDGLFIKYIFYKDFICIYLYLITVIELLFMLMQYSNELFSFKLNFFGYFTHTIYLLHIMYVYCTYVHILQWNNNYTIYDTHRYAVNSKYKKLIWFPLEFLHESLRN